MRNSANRWFMAGIIAGALGMGIGMGLTKGSSRQMRQARRNAANMAVKFTQNAGDFIGGLGRDLADKIR